MLWRPDRSANPSLAEVIDQADLTVLVQVDADFGPRGPNLTALNRSGRGKRYLVDWPDLSRVLGQDVPYWPYLLRDPELVAAWQPHAAAVIAPARTDLDSYPLLRMAAMFDAGHPTARTLVNLVQIDQSRATRDARDDHLPREQLEAARRAGRPDDQP